VSATFILSSHLFDFLGKTKPRPSKQKVSKRLAWSRVKNERLFEICHAMPALKFKTCRLLAGNVWKRQPSKIQRRILQRLRRRGIPIKRYLLLFQRENRNLHIKLQTIRKVSLAKEKCKSILYQMRLIFMECVPRRWVPPGSSPKEGLK